MMTEQQTATVTPATCPSTSALAAAIGSRVRQERQSRGWTLDQLAEATGVSRRMMVNVEQGATNPSVMPDVVELWDWTMAPGDTHRSEAHSPGTKELLQVQEGSISVVVAGEAFILEAGDAVSFPGDVEHSYGAVGKEPARFSLAVFEPGVGPGHRPEATDA